MIIKCIWEHNGSDTLLWAVDFPGAFSRGETQAAAFSKMNSEIRSYCAWAGLDLPELDGFEIVQESACSLCIRDADSDVLFDEEKLPLTAEEYQGLKDLALKSASDLLKLYTSIPDKEAVLSPIRKTFYGDVPRTAEQMYIHTKNVNEYYFGEIGIDADNEGSILECRVRGFEALEKQADFLSGKVFDGSYGELWSLRKLIRRFIWHDRIHARAMYRHAVRIWGNDSISDIFGFNI